MAFFNGFVLGVSPFLGYTSTVSVFNQIVLVGGDTYFDNITLLNYEMTDEEIANDTIGNIPTWTPQTLLLATFDGYDFSAGNIVGITDSILYYDFFRSEVGDTQLTKLATVDVSQGYYIDYTAKPNKDYIYTIIAKNDTELSNSIEAEITTDFYGDYLIRISDLKTYKFDLNLSHSAFTSEVAVKRYDGFNKYSAHSFGERDFITGSVSAIIQEGCTDIDFTQTEEFIKEFREFINDGSEKIFKTRKGEVYKVKTMNFASNVLNINIASQPYIISFNFEESGEVDG